MDRNEHESERRGIPLQRVLTDTSDRSKAIGLLVAVVVVGGFALIVAIAVGAAEAWPVLVPCVIALAILIPFAMRSARVWLGWENPQIYLPSSEPLHLGDHVVVRFRRRARGRAQAAGSKVTARIEVEEQATYQQGTDTHTAKDVVYRADVPVELHDVVDQAIEVDLAIDIPLAEAPPSMSLRNNDVVWRLVVDIEAPDAPDDESTFPLIVAPEIAQRLIDGGVGR